MRSEQVERRRWRTGVKGDGRAGKGKGGKRQVKEKEDVKETGD